MKIDVKNIRRGSLSLSVTSCPLTGACSFQLFTRSIFTVDRVTKMNETHQARDIVLQSSAQVLEAGSRGGPRREIKKGHL